MSIGEVVTEKQNILERNISKREFVHHKSHTDWPVKWHQNPANESWQLIVWIVDRPWNSTMDLKKSNPEDGSTQHKKLFKFVASHTVFRQFTRNSKYEPNLTD